MAMRKGWALQPSQSCSQSLPAAFPALSLLAELWLPLPAVSAGAGVVFLMWAVPGQKASGLEVL